MNTEPTILKGGLAIDDRGTLSFVNDFNFEGVKRFYRVANHSPGLVRAWHGHEKEGKYVYVTHGSILIATVKLETLRSLDKGYVGVRTNVVKHVLSGISPWILWIPPGYANGFKTLTADASTIFFSTSTMEEAKTDDFRFHARIIPGVWDIIER